MIQFFKTAQKREAEKLSWEILKLNKKIEDCEVCILDAVIHNDVNGKISYQSRKKSLNEEREELIKQLKNIN